MLTSFWKDGRHGPELRIFDSLILFLQRLLGLGKKGGHAPNLFASTRQADPVLNMHTYARSGAYCFG
jgi:hypothetical protein